MEKEKLNQLIQKKLSEYTIHNSIDRVADYVYFSDKYGKLRMKGYRILQGSQITSRSAVNPCKYLSSKIKALNPHLRIISTSFKATNNYVDYEYEGVQYRSLVYHLLTPNFIPSKFTYKIDKQQYYIDKLTAIWGDQYDFSKTIVGKYDDKITVICPIHGEFAIRLGQMLTGHGCRKCANEALAIHKTMTTEEYVEKANQVHHNKYLYNKTQYTQRDCIVTIECPIHGEFICNSRAHLQGAGCPKCKSGKGIDTLYLLYDINTDLYKIGVCKGHPKNRISRIKQSANRGHGYPHKIQLVAYWNNGEYIFEHKIHKELNKYNYEHPIYKCGAREWFKFDTLSIEIHHLLTKLIQTMRQNECYSGIL